MCRHRRRRRQANFLLPPTMKCVDNQFILSTPKITIEILKMTLEFPKKSCKQGLPTTWVKKRLWAMLFPSLFPGNAQVTLRFFSGSSQVNLRLSQVISGSQLILSFSLAAKTDTDNDANCSKVDFCPFFASLC